MGYLFILYLRKLNKKKIMIPHYHWQIKTKRRKRIQTMIFRKNSNVRIPKDHIKTKAIDNPQPISRSFVIKQKRIKEMESMVGEKGRYSTESIRISRSEFDLKELDRLANRSRALANDTLYLLRQYYFFHNTKDLEKKKLYRKSIESKFYKIIKESEYPNEKKERAIEMLDDLFVRLRALKSTIPTIMKFMESYKDIGYNLGLISDPRQSLNDRINRLVSKFIATPPISFSPSNGLPSKPLKREERLNKSKIKPQKYQMSPRDFLAMTQTAYV